MLMFATGLLAFVALLGPKTEAPPPAPTYACTWKDETHPAHEIGANWPDAVLALDAPKEAKLAATEGKDNEDELVFEGGHYVRGTLAFRIEGGPADWALGLWVKLTPADYATWSRGREKGHAPLPCTLANQTPYGAPTLGTRCEIQFVKSGIRPRIVITDAQHPLNTKQKKGLGAQEWRSWLSNQEHLGQPQPAAPVFVPTLKDHGWRILEPAGMGKTPVQRPAKVGAGTLVKIGSAVVAADKNGQPKELNIGWWILLDDASGDVWSGTLNNVPRIPTTLDLGSRVWLRPNQVVEYQQEE